MPTSITSKLYRAKNLFIHQKVDTVCIKSYPHVFKHLGRNIGGFKIGHQYRLDYYIARIFVEEGYLEFEDKDRLDSTVIKKINYKESSNPELHPIQDLIYVQTLEHLEILERLYHDDKISKETYKELISDLNDLITVRVPKITRLSNKPHDLRAQKKLTFEEKVLYEALSQSLEEWRETLSHIKKKR